MIFLFRFSIYFIINFLILSIPIHKQTLFTYLQDATNPIVGPVLQNISDSFQKTAETSRRLYSNSEPKINDGKLSDVESQSEN
jgi:hypothetical protein